MPPERHCKVVLMEVPNSQLTTNFSAKCQLTTIFLANSQLTILILVSYYYSSSNTLRTTNYTGTTIVTYKIYKVNAPYAGLKRL